MKFESYLSCTVFCTSLFISFICFHVSINLIFFFYINFATEIKSENFLLVLDFVLSRFNTQIQNANENGSMKSRLVGSHDDGLLICKYWHPAVTGPSSFVEVVLFKRLPASSRRLGLSTLERVCRLLNQTLKMSSCGPHAVSLVLLQKGEELTSWQGASGRPPAHALGTATAVSCLEVR